jgi:hypothetical protein
MNGRTLIIPAGEIDAKRAGEAEEDLNVMARILEKAAGSKESARYGAMGIQVESQFLGTPPPLRNLYIEGYGAILFLNVRFPLLPPPQKESEPKSKETPSSEWDDARDEIYGRWSGDQGAFGSVVIPAAEAAPEYDADHVEHLKRDLAEALKNAAHIRTLKDEETITLVVTGRGAPGPGRLLSEQPILGRLDSAGEPGAASIDRAATKRPDSLLILRVKKSQAVAFQKGALDFDGFRKKLAITLY